MKRTAFLILLSLFLSYWCVFPSPASEPIKIASIFAKTGIAAPVQIEAYEFINLAVEEINRQGGLLGRRIEVIEYDNQSTALGSKQVAQEAVKADVTAVIGASWSSHSLAMAPVLQEAGIPMISPISTNPKVTQVGNYIFRVCFTDPFQGKVMARFADRDLKAKTAVILTNISSDYSMGLAEFFKAAFLEDKKTVLWEGKYVDKTTDFSEILNKTKSLQPDVVFNPGYYQDSGLLIRQAKAMGIKAFFLGGDGWNEVKVMYDTGGEAVEGIYYCGHWRQEVPNPLSKKVLNDFRHKYGRDPTTEMILAYDCVLVLADAVKRARSTDRSKIREALAATKGLQCATGIITFDENRDPKDKEAVIQKIAKGSAVFVKIIKP
jgi:branched-chain amino acid transport system substrate-binding protein